MSMVLVKLGKTIAPMRFAAVDEVMGAAPQAVAYSPQERAEDKMLLRSLQRGELGSGPNIDKAIQDIINRINGVRVRGV
jgi:hypothetical protein